MIGCSGMTIGDEYRLQTWLGIVQASLGLIAWLSNGIQMRLTGWVTKENDWTVSLVRQAGFACLLLPIAWVIFTIKKEQDQTSRWSRRHTIVSGLALAFLMNALMGWSSVYGRYYPKFQPVMEL